MEDPSWEIRRDAAFLLGGVRLEHLEEYKARRNDPDVRAFEAERIERARKDLEASAEAMWRRRAERAEAAVADPVGDTLVAARDFRSVLWRGHTWSFKRKAADAVKYLAERHKRGWTAQLEDIRIASGSDATPLKLSKLFRGDNAVARDGTRTIGDAKNDALIVRVGAGRYGLNPGIRRIVPEEELADGEKKNSP